VIRQLIAALANLNNVMSDNKTPLMYAACFGSNDGISQLIYSRADPTIETYPGQTAATLAATKGHLTSVRALVESGVDVNQQTQLFKPETVRVGSCEVALKGQTALICAIASFQDRTASMIIEELKADVELETTAGVTTLMAAADAQNTSMLQMLVQAKADPNRQTRLHSTALIHAAELDRATSISVLRQLGADPFHESHRFGTALIVASQSGHSASVTALAESELQAAGGIDQETRSGMTALTSAGVANQDGVISLLLQHKAAADRATCYDLTALEICIKSKSHKSIDSMLRHGADPDRPGRFGGNPRVQALETGDRQVITRLVRAEPLNRVAELTTEQKFAGSFKR